ncbi:MAG: branched-chain amino acid ABC transporter permease [Acidimicrobiia bacterium]|nr:branched-chain amino acid ABC transporter permease [Acidimicrobiia bacterium]
MTLYGQAIISGVLIGGLYAMMSLGVSLSWGVLKIINLAYFSFILLAGYGSYELAATQGWDPFVTVVAVVPVAVVAGALLQLFFEKVNIGEFESLLVTFGLFIMFESVASSVWSADFRRIPSTANPYASSSLKIGGFAFATPQLSAFITAIVVGLLVKFLLDRTYFGKAVRALAQDREMARAFGVDHRRVAVLLAGLASATAAIAGVFIAMSQALFPGLAVEWFGIVFPVVILGGLGSTLGALGAGVTIGVVAAVASVTWGPSYAPLATFVILIATLLFRPEGLFTRKASV